MKDNDPLFHSNTPKSTRPKVPHATRDLLTPRSGRTKVRMSRRSPSRVGRRAPAIDDGHSRFALPEHPLSDGNSRLR